MAKNLDYAELCDSKVELTDVPLILRKAVLMSQGIWNNVYYGKNEIKRALSSTDWTSREKSNLFLDHKDFEASEWIGEVRNRYFKNDTLYGDLIIYDPIWAAKLKYGKPKVGISPKVAGDYSEKDKSMRNFTFENFSLVINPAVKTAFINNMEVMKVDEKEIEAVLKEDVKKQEEPEKMPDEEEEPEEDEEMKAKSKEKDILSAAKSILEKKRAEVDKEDTLMENALSFLSELKLADAGAITKKAKEIRKEGESFKDAIRRAAKMAEEEKEEETPEEEEEKAPEAPAAEKEGGAKEAPTEAEARLQEKIAGLEKRIETMSKTLDEPVTTMVARKSVKELSDAELDEGMLTYLQKMEVEK